MNPQPHTKIEPLSEEELAERRLELLKTTDYSLLRALKAGGIRTSHQGGHFIAVVTENLCPNRCPVDPERPTLTQWRIERSGGFCPICEARSSVAAVLDRFMKTKSQKMKFLKKAQPYVVDGEDICVVEAGPNYERRGVDTDIQKAIDEAGATPDEPLRACKLHCRDRARAVEIADEQRDSLPWAEGLKLRPDGDLPADWHKGRLTIKEQQLLERQQYEDRRAKKARRDRIIREIQREPI